MLVASSSRICLMEATLSLSLSLSKHSLPAHRLLHHFSPRCILFSLNPHLHRHHALRRSPRFSAVATQLTETPPPTAPPPPTPVLPTNQSSRMLLRIRHTCAHVMAMAVQKIFPEAKVTIGPLIENGFYYDFDVEPLTDQDLKKIKKEMEEAKRRGPSSNRSRS